MGGPRAALDDVDPAAVVGRDAVMVRRRGIDEPGGGQVASSPAASADQRCRATRPAAGARPTPAADHRAGDAPGAVRRGADCAPRASPRPARPGASARPSTTRGTRGADAGQHLVADGADAGRPTPRR